ncbi:methylated-DNA--[protein]-cysteine S-methyltransferase [Candidatus Albibeggiatoa sp. nov. NOAA]|uniref:methylated-DNA--[protein]-cysteine S-methyltransferase n=1 Tax=Candidatus Albibeggiatoa sp. nov. NOAA TaxID=3162724 RepID=UPI0033424C93
MTTETSYYHSPVGYLELIANDTALIGCYFLDDEPSNITEPQHPILKQTHQQLEAYFNQGLQDFDIPLDLQGTAFRQQAWQALQTIPYGQTASYLDMAVKIGNPKAVRAIGQANGQNPVSIIVPCHRVINHNGKLGGYGGGLWRKEWLLAHEKKHLNQNS